MPCEKCGNLLLIGKEDKDTLLWCPICESIELIEKKELIKTIGERQKNLFYDKNKILNKYTKDSIIGCLCATLESISAQKNGTFIRCDLLCSVAYAIRDVQGYDTFGANKIDPYLTDFQDLCHIYDSLFQGQYIIQSLIHDDYLVGIKIPLRDVPHYALLPPNFDSKNFELQIESEKEKKTICLKFTEDWDYNRLLASRFGIINLNDAYTESTGISLWPKKQTILDALDRTKIGFDFAVGTSTLLNDIEKNIDLFEVIKHIRNHFLSSFTPKLTEFEKTTGVLKPVQKNEIITALKSISDKPEELYSRLLSIKFPVIVECNNINYVLSNSCEIYLNLLYSEIASKDINVHRSFWGEWFEKLIFYGLQIYNYEVSNPNTGEPLLNFKVMGDEMDVGGYTTDQSIIIECKHFDIGSNFFRRSKIEERKKNLRMQLHKFENKIALLKKDPAYSFMTEGKTLHAFFVTLHPEPLDDIEGIQIVAYEDFPGKIVDLNPPEPTESLDINIEKGVVSCRFYKKGHFLIGIDYTKLITNSFGIKHFAIPPNDKFGSYIFVGDGIVHSLDDEELEIRNPDEALGVIVDLTEQDIEYLKSMQINKGDKVRYQIYTKDPKFSTYYLRFIKKFED